MIIPNQSDTRFTYTLPDGSTQTETRESNIVTTEILTYSFTKVKTSNKTFLQEGDVATQTVTLSNASLINVTNVFFRAARPTSRAAWSSTACRSRPLTL